MQSLKKTVTKGDKKRKKEVDAEIETLEKDFEQKCRIEIQQLENELKSENVTKIEQKEQNQAESTATLPTSTKTSKSKKKREKKEKSSEDREKLIQLQEIENKKGPAYIELTKIKDKMKQMNLKIKDVRSDGNCMYYAIIDQLKQNPHLEQLQTYQELRTLTSQYMLKNPNEFQAYLCSEETGDPLDEQQYEEYCHKIKDTLAWGSQIELKAISDLLKVNIQVIQSEGSDIQIGDSNEDKLVITYHRFMFGSGEHYNSTCPNIESDSNEEDT